MANRTIVEADRPWVSGLITVDDFEIGKIPKATLLWQNFGRRPAYTVEWGRKGKALKALPAVPFYDPPDPNDSDGTVVPGGRTVSAFDLTKGPLTVSDMGSLNSTKVVYFVYGFIKYKDVRTNHIYHSHVCYRYFPARPIFRQVGSSAHAITTKIRSNPKTAVSQRLILNLTLVSQVRYVKNI